MRKKISSLLDSLKMTLNYKTAKCQAESTSMQRGELVSDRMVFNHICFECHAVSVSEFRILSDSFRMTIDSCFSK